MIWSLMEGPVIDFGLASILAYAAFSLLKESRRLLKNNLNPVTPIENISRVIATAGVPGYFAAFIFVTSGVCMALGIYSLIFNISSNFG